MKHMRKHLEEMRNTGGILSRLMGKAGININFIICGTIAFYYQFTNSGMHES